MATLLEHEKRILFAEIDTVPALRGLGVVFIGRGECRLLREQRMPRGLRTWIVLQDDGAGAEPGPEPSRAARESHLLRESISAGLSCASVLFTGAGVLVGIGGAPLTAGSSTTLTVLSWAGLVASSAQCANGTWRVFNEICDPEMNDQLDSHQWYRIANDVLDGVALAGGVASLGQAAQAAVRLGRTSGRPLIEVLRGMTRAERKRLAQDLARYTGDATTRRQFIRLAREGKITSIFRRHEVTRGVVRQLLNAVSSGLTFTGSAGFGVLRTITVRLVLEQ
jgi:hypothetical protein